MLVTVVESYPKAPFSIATTLRCWRGATPFPGLLHFTLDRYLILLSVKQRGIKYYFKVFGMTRPGIKPRSLGPLANTLSTRSMSCQLTHTHKMPKTPPTTPSCVFLN